jgi:tetratricopeptide (TPR) repeat protein
VCASCLLPAMVSATLTSLPCHPFLFAHFFLVLVPPTVVLSCLLGLALKHWILSWRRWLFATLGCILLTTPSTLYTILCGPQVSAFNHVIGYIPGPLYDEELKLPSSLLWYRLGTVVLILLLFALVSKKRRWAFAFGAVLVVLEVNGDRLGFRTTESTLKKHLSETEQSRGLVFHHEPMDALQAKNIFDDLRFRQNQLETFFGPTEGEVHVWYYPSAEAKQRWVGAAHTQFSKPWRREVHINALGVPHPVAKHELVHALAAPYGNGFFRVTSEWGGLVLHTGIIEGLAVAADNPVDDLSLHEWSAAMKRKGLLPNVRDALSPRGFFFANASRAYTASGSFLRFLVETYGSEKVKKLYAKGDFEGAYGQSLSVLATQWERFLDGVVLDESQINAAFQRFRGGSLFERRCAREVEILKDEMTTSTPGEALDSSRRCLVLQPDEPSLNLAVIQRLRSAGKVLEAQRALEASLLKFQSDSGAWSNAALLQVEMLGDNNPSSRRLLESVLQKKPPASVLRTALVRLLAFDMPATSRDALGVWFSGRADSIRVGALQEALLQDPENAVLHYLLGRQLARDGAPEKALEHLSERMLSKLPEALRLEAQKLVLEALTQLHRCDEMRPMTGFSFHRFDEARARCVYLAEVSGLQSK